MPDSTGTLLRDIWTKNFIEGGFPLASDELCPFRLTLMTERWVVPPARVLYALSLCSFLQIIVWHKTGWTLSEPGMYFKCKTPSDIQIIACSIIKTVWAFPSKYGNSCYSTSGKYALSKGILAQRISQCMGYLPALLSRMLIWFISFLNMKVFIFLWCLQSWRWIDITDWPFQCGSRLNAAKQKHCFATIFG